jgi:hypothetical protein
LRRLLLGLALAVVRQRQPQTEQQARRDATAQVCQPRLPPHQKRGREQRRHCGHDGEQLPQGQGQLGRVALAADDGARLLAAQARLAIRALDDGRLAAALGEQRRDVLQSQLGDALHGRGRRFLRGRLLLLL